MNRIMVSRWVVFGILISTGVGGIWSGCSEDEDTSKDTAAPTAETPATAATLNLTEGSASEILGTSFTTIQSASIGTLAISSLQLNQTQSVNDPSCDSNGDPWYGTTESDNLSSNKDWVPKKFYCKVNSGVIESTDTIPGFIRMQQSIFCSIEEVFAISKDSYTTAGVELVTGGQATLTLSEACWSQGQPDGIESIPVSSVIATRLDDSVAGWQYQLKMTSEAIGSATVKFFNNDGIMGFQMFQPGNDPGAGSDLKVVIDTTKGVMLFNEVEDRNGAGGADSVYRRLARIRVKGSLTSELSFSELTEARGYLYESGPDFDASANQDHTYNVFTVDGNNSTGWQFKSYNTGNTPGLPAESTSVCSDGDGTCSGSNDIGTIEAMSTYFKGASEVRDIWKSYAASGLPMCEPENGSSADITIAAQPIYTGALGLCTE